MIWPCDWSRDHVSLTPTKMWNYALEIERQRKRRKNSSDFFSSLTDTKNFYFHAFHFSSFPIFVLIVKYRWEKEKSRDCVLNVDLCFNVRKVNKFMNET